MVTKSHFQLIALLFLLAIFSVLFVICTLCLTKLGESKRRNDEEKYSYQYLTKNIQENKTTQGIVSYPEEMLVDEDYLLFVSMNGNYHLISNFGTENYECSGSCVCSEVGDRRNSFPMIVKRGLLLLVAALSSVVALESARKSFEDECVKLYQDQCPENSKIQSEVDLCSTIEPGSRTLEEIERDLQSEKEEEERKLYDHLRKKGKRESWKKWYICEGNCVRNWHLKTVHSIASAEFGCEKLSLKSEIHSDDPDTQPGTDLLAGYIAGHGELRILNTFVRNHLEPYCKRSSLQQVEEKSLKLKLSLCDAGGLPDSLNIFGLNKSLRCRKMY